MAVASQRVGRVQALVQMNQHYHTKAPFTFNLLLVLVQLRCQEPTERPEASHGTSNSVLVIRLMLLVTISGLMSPWKKRKKRKYRFFFK